MRFELSAEDVGNLVGILDYLLREAVASLAKDDFLGKNLLKYIRGFYRKLKTYGVSAFDSREDYRNTIASLKEELEYQEKRFAVIKRD